jgi:ABC-2 type transport system ATP-binding protein
MAPSSGTVRIGGTDLVESDTSARASIGWLPEDPPLYLDMTVAAFLDHVHRLKGRPAEANRIAEVIDTCQLTGRADQVIRTLSHGYRKRVGIAQAIVHDPRLVILDEPISGLDPQQIVEMRRVIRALGKGRAVILSSHILGEISQTCDRILVLHRGRLVAHGTEAELSRASGDRLALTVRGESAPFEAWLRAQPGVQRVDPKPAAPGLARVELRLAADTRETLVAAAAAQGFRIRLVEDPHDELEEIFLGLTQTTGAEA